MKRGTRLVIALMLVVAVLSACTATNTPGASTAGETTAAGQATAANETPAAAETTEPTEPSLGEDASVPDLNGVTLNIVTMETYDSNSSLASVLPKFQQIEQRTGVKLNWEVIKSDYNTVIQTRLAASSLPDIIALPVDSAMMGKLIDNGVLYNIGAVMAEVAPDINFFYTEGQPGLRKSFTYTDGGIYCLPNASWASPEDHTDWVSLNGDNAIWYRGDIADELGIAMPRTIDQVHDMYLKVKQAYPDMIVCHMWDWSCWQSVRIFNGAYGLHYNNNTAGSYFYPDANGKIQFEPMLPATEQWLTEMHKWNKEGLITLTMSGEEKYGLPASGKVFSGFYAETNMVEPDLKKNVGEQAYLTFMPFPTGPDGKCTIAGRNEYENITAIVNNGEDQAKAALKYLNYAFYSPYGIASNAFGVEGEGWSWSGAQVEQNLDQLTKIIKQEMTLPSTGASIWFMGPHVYKYDYMLMNKERTLEVQKELGLPPSRTEAQQKNWDEVSAINGSFYFPLFPFMYLSTEDQDRINELSTDVGTYTDEMLTKFILGDEPLSNFSAFVDTLQNQLHIQDMIDIYQAAYDRYTKS